MDLPQASAEENIEAEEETLKEDVDNIIDDFLHGSQTATGILIDFVYLQALVTM